MVLKIYEENKNGVSFSILCSRKWNQQILIDCLTSPAWSVPLMWCLEASRWLSVDTEKWEKAAAKPWRGSGALFMSQKLILCVPYRDGMYSWRISLFLWFLCIYSLLSYVTVYTYMNLCVLIYIHACIHIYLPIYLYMYIRTYMLDYMIMRENVDNTL